MSIHTTKSGFVFTTGSVTPRIDDQGLPHYAILTVSYFDGSKRHIGTNDDWPLPSDVLNDPQAYHILFTRTDGSTEEFFKRSN